MNNIRTILRKIRLKSLHLVKPNYKAILAILSILAVVGLVITFVLFPPVWAPRFKKADRDSSYIYAAENKIFNVEIGIKDANKPFVQFSTSENSSMKFSLLDSAETIEKPIKKGNKITFEEIMNGVDLSYETLTNGIKEEIVLKQAPQSNEFLFTMELEATGTQEIMADFPNPVFYDENGNYLFHFAEPFAFDASGNRTDEVTMQIKKSPIESNYQLRLSVDEQWLYSPDRVYPITIDPTVLHDTSGEFDNGEFNRVADSGAAQIEAYYEELPKDEDTSALYHMDTAEFCGAGDLYVCDTSGKSRTGTLNGSAARVAGKFDTGIDTGSTTSDYLGLPAVDIGNEWTAEIWFKMPLTSTGSSWHTLLKGNPNDHQVIVQRSDMQLGMYDNATAGAFRGTGFIINTLQDGWHHMAVVGIGGNQNFYIDGDYVGKTDTQSTTEISAVGNVSSGSQNWGTFDELRISNIARSHSEIKAAAARRPYGEYTSPVIDLGEEVTEWVDLSWTENGVKTGDGETVFNSSNLIAQWNFNETSGTTANNDAEGTSCGGTPSDCDGTLTGFDSTAGQDAAVQSTWTSNKRWGAGALLFDGTNSEVTCTDANCGGATKLDIETSNWTIESWVNTTKTTRQNIVGKGNNPGEFSYALETGLDNTGQADFFLFNVADTTYMRANGATFIADGKWHHIVGTYDGTTISIYVDGILDGSSTTKTGTQTQNTPGSFSIGSRAGTSLYFDGLIDAVKVYRRALSSTEVISNYNAANVQFQVRTGPDSSPEDGDWTDWTPSESATQIESFDGPYLYNTTDSGLITYMPMDESSDNTCSGGQDSCDVIGGYHGTSTGTTIVDGVFDKARGFNGTSNYIYGSTSMPLPTGDFTYEAWIKPDTTSDEMIFMASDGAGLNEIYIFLASTNKLLVATNNVNRLTTATIITKDWQHIAVTRNGSTITAYINGVADLNTGSDATVLNFGGCGLLIGTDADSGCNGVLGNWFNGRIDEPRIYNTALSATTIRQHFLAASTNPDMLSNSSNGGVLTIEGNVERVYIGTPQLDNSTATLLHLDETNGDNAGVDVFDESSNNVDGEFNGTGIATAVVDGKAGKARSFNGSSDYIDLGNPAAMQITGDQTISMWLYPTDFSLRRNPYAKAFGGEGTITQELNQTLNYYYGTGGGNTTPYQAFNSSGTLTANQWNHIAIVRDLTNSMLYWYINGVQTNQVAATYSAAVASALNAYVGTGYTNPYAGRIDEVAIYSAALPAKEIEDMYKMGQGNQINKTITSVDLSSKDTVPFYVAGTRPGSYMDVTFGESEYDNYYPDANIVGLWHMEDKGGSIKDSSGYGRDATLAGGTLNFSQGKLGNAFKFNGATYLDTGAKYNFGASNFTFDFWLNPTLSANSIILSNGAFNTDGYYLHVQADGSLHFYTNQSGANQLTSVAAGTVKANIWNHIVLVRNGSSVTIYVNGQNETSTAGTHISPSTPSYNLHFGSHVASPASWYYTGLLDEMRISNTARTVDDVRKSYEVGRRTHPITIDFAATLDDNFGEDDLITDSSDLKFKINATELGLPKMGSNLHIGDKIIVREKIDASIYVAQGTVKTANETSGEVTVTGWDASSSFPSAGFTKNATAFKWQKEYFDLSGVAIDSQIDAVDNVTFRVTEGAEGKILFLDDMNAATNNYLTTPSGSTITADTGVRYLQYKAFFNSSDPDLSANFTSLTLDYETESPSAYWKFDENYGSTAYDHSTNALNGTITGATWAESGRCASRTCLEFDGANDNVSFGDQLDYNLNNGDEFTTGGWFRTVNDTSNQIILSKKSGIGTSAGYILYTTATGEVKFNMGDGVSTELTVTSPAVYNDNNWHYAAATVDSSDVILYVDGVEVDTESNTLSTADLSNAQNFLIGEDGSGAGDFDGLIDEVRVYNYARTESQVKADYNAVGSSVKGASASFGPDDTFLSNDLVGYWPMNHTSGNAPDYSGNDFTGTETGTGITEGTAGRYDFAADFNGTTGTYYDMGDQAEFELQEFTVSAWVRKEGSCGFNNCAILYHGMSGNTGWGLRLLGASPVAQLSLRDNLLNATGTTPILDNTWYHVAGTIDGQKMRLYVNGQLESEVDQTIFPTYGTNHLTIGNGNTNKDLSFNGKIDEARYYNRALSPKEVEGLYRWSAGPAGYWPMEENTGTSTTYDKSGNNNNGSLTGMEEGDWTSGRYGSALQLDGTSSEYVTVTDNNALDAKNITISAWVKRNADSGLHERIISKDNDYSDYLYYLQISNIDTVQGGFNDAASTTVSNHVATGTTAIPVGTWNHLALSYDGVTIRVYLNGILEGSTSYTGTIPASSGNLNIGRLISDGSYLYSFNGAIDEAKIYNYARSSNEILEDVNGGHPVGGSPESSMVGHWSLDELTGQAVNNRGLAGGSGTRGTDGTGTTDDPVWTQSSGCKVNSCALFDGSADFIEIADNSAYEFPAADAQFSISSWVNLNTTPSEYAVILGKYNSSITAREYFLGFDTSRRPVLYMSEDGGGTNRVQSSTTAINTGAWYHIAATVDMTTDKYRLFINGEEVATTSSGSVISTMHSSSANLTIGAVETSATSPDLMFPGYLDEVKLYNTELTIAEIKLDMNAGSTAAMGGVLGANERSYLGVGSTEPVGIWHFDENTGTSITYDQSGNTRNGTLTSMTESSWVPGKYGSALQFDGTADIVTISDSPDLYDFDNDFTLSMWIKRSGTSAENEAILSRGANGDWQYVLSKDSSTNRLICKIYQANSGVDYLQANGVTAINDGEWHNVVCAVSGTNVYLYIDGKLDGSDSTPTGSRDISSAGELYFGQFDWTTSKLYYGGLLDEVKIFDYALSVPQIQYEYNRGKPNNWWKLDECTGTTANDSGSAGLNGTITIGGTGTNTSAGTCTGSAGEAWNDGASGRYNASLEFDGTDDQISMGSSTNTIEGLSEASICAWIKYSPDTITTDGAVVSRYDGSLAGWLMWVDDDAAYSGRTDTLSVAFAPETSGGRVEGSTGLVEPDTWGHYCGVFKGGNYIRLYKNGNLDQENTTSVAATVDTTSNTLYVGRIDNVTPRWFEGLIDDVRIYNYALSGNQIKNILNEGASVRFGE